MSAAVLFVQHPSFEIQINATSKLLTSCGFALGAVVEQYQSIA
jgi:hypothetical protein